MHLPVVSMLIIAFLRPRAGKQKMASSKAAEIPEELFEGILWHAAALDEDSPRRKEGKQHLPVYASVNKYWACLIRPRLFSSITLRNQDDAKRFLEILDAPTVSGLEPIATEVSTLTATSDSSDVPWLHLAFFFILPKLPSVILHVVPLHSGTRPLKTLHPSLPRSLPASAMPIWVLRLNGLCFPTGRVLLSLLSSIRYLTSFGTSNLTFGTRPSPEDFSTIPFRSWLHDVVTDDLQLLLSLIPVAISGAVLSGGGSRLSRRPEAIVNDNDLNILCDLLSIFDAASRFSITMDHLGESQPNISQLVDCTYSH